MCIFLSLQDFLIWETRRVNRGEEKHPALQEAGYGLHLLHFLLWPRWVEMCISLRSEVDVNVVTPWPSNSSHDAPETVGQPQETQQLTGLGTPQAQTLGLKRASGKDQSVLPALEETPGSTGWSHTVPRRAWSPDGRQATPPNGATSLAVFLVQSPGFQPPQEICSSPQPHGPPQAVLARSPPARGAGPKNTRKKALVTCPWGPGACNGATSQTCSCKPAV